MNEFAVLPFDLLLVYSSSLFLYACLSFISLFCLNLLSYSTSKIILYVCCRLYPLSVLCLVCKLVEPLGAWKAQLLFTANRDAQSYWFQAICSMIKYFLGCFVLKCFVLKTYFIKIVQSTFSNYWKGNAMRIILCADGDSEDCKLGCWCVFQNTLV